MSIAEVIAKLEELAEVIAKLEELLEIAKLEELLESQRDELTGPGTASGASNPQG